MTAEPIAAVVADIRAGRIHHPAATDKAGAETSAAMLERARKSQPVVDCTAIFHMQRVADEIRLYDDHPCITPPWDDALLCYVNTFNNVVAMQVHRTPWGGSAPRDWFTDNEVDWSRVSWVAETAIWVGGVSGDGVALPTSGPCHLFRHAIRDDRGPEDINWIALMQRRGQFGSYGQVEDANQSTWDAAMITLGAALNFLNASNVDIAEPVRPFPVRQRLRKTRVQVQTIVIRPPGKRRAKSAAARPIDAAEMVLSPVRGHWSRYGEQYNRGLLFGKYSGKFWIPAHARGGGGEPEPRDYLLKPAKVTL